MDAKTWKNEHMGHGGGGGGFSKADGRPLRMVAGKGIWITGGCVEMRPLMLSLALESSLEHLQSVSRKLGT